MGVATKIEEYVPTITPMIIANEKPFSMAPPKIYMEPKASKVVMDVIKVLDKVSFVEVSEISEIEIFEYFS